MKSGNKKPIVVDGDPSLSQQSTFPPLVFNSIKNKDYFPPLNASDSVGTADYDAQIETQIDKSTNHLFKTMSFRELNTLPQICELQRTQLLTTIAMSGQNLNFAGYLLTGYPSNFLHVEGSTACSYDRP